MQTRFSARAGFFVALASTVYLLESAWGDTLKWDTQDDGTPITEGPGGWNGSLINWNNGIGSTSYASGSDVVFGGGGVLTPAYTVVIDPTGVYPNVFNPTANSITFNSGARYTLTDPSGNRVLTITSGNIFANSDGIIEASLKAGAGGSTELTKWGEGTLELGGGTAIATGLTSVRAGRLDLNKPGVNAIGASGLTIHPATMVRLLQNDQISNDATVTLLNGTLDLTTRNDQIDSLQLVSGSVIGSGRLTASTFNVEAGTISANVFSGPLNKTTSGTVVLGADNPDYTGAININAGTIQIGAGGASGKLGSGLVTISANATLSINRGDSGLIIGNKITGAGKVENQSSAGATVTLNNDNIYTGGTTLTSGTLKLGNAGALPAGGAVTFNGGHLDLNNQDVTASRTLGALTLQASSSLFLDPANGTHGSLTFNNASWTGGLLSIYGWTPSAGATLPRAGSGDRIFISGTAASGFLEHVRFYTSLDDSAPIGGAAAILPGTYELVPDYAPVPEPINVALGLFGVIWGSTQIARRYRRR